MLSLARRTLRHVDLIWIENSQNGLVLFHLLMFNLAGDL
jgi:hypothetical protein